MNQETGNKTIQNEEYLSTKDIKNTLLKQNRTYTTQTGETIRLNYIKQDGVYFKISFDINGMEETLKGTSVYIQNKLNEIGTSIDELFNDSIYTGTGWVRG